jgi:hypothetical protein
MSLKLKTFAQEAHKNNPHNREKSGNPTYIYKTKT